MDTSIEAKEEDFGDMDMDMDLDMDLDLDLDMDMEEDTETEKDIDIETLQYEEAVEEDTEENEEIYQVKMGKKSLRNYMSQMRLKDKKLFQYKSDKNYSAYSIKCGAVDMRQPILLTKAEMENFEKVNLGFQRT